MTYCLSCFCCAHVHGFTVRIFSPAIAGQWTAYEYHPTSASAFCWDASIPTEDQPFNHTVCVVLLVKFVVFCAASGIQYRRTTI